MSGRFACDLSFGATCQTDGSTRFRLWAPDCTAVGLEIEAMPSQNMRAEGDGWFSATADCGPRTRYRYRVRPDLAVPDPASRAQAEDVHGASEVIDPHAFTWRHDDWQGRPWHEAVLYEFHPGLCGGFRGGQQRLAALADLGVTAVELMPIADFPGGRNWGYDGVLPFAPDKAYGTPDELKSLVDAAHGLGLMVFLDVVYNHFGPEGNHIGAYASRFFQTDVSTPWGPAIDFRRPEVRRFFIENALYWIIEYRFDGLRLDAVHAIGDAGWLNELTTEVRTAIEPGRHVHLVLEHDGNAASHLTTGFDAQWNDDGHHALHVLLTGERDGYYEDYADAPARHLARCLAEGFAWQGEPSRHRGGHRRGEPSGHLPPTSFVLFLQNHDQIGNRAFGERLATLCDLDALKAAVALVLLSPQIPLLFMGEEWGSRTPFQYFTSHSDTLAAAVREGRRREFARFPAFASREDRARIPDPNDPATYRASQPQPPADAHEWLSFYSCLLELRHRTIVRRLPGARSTGARPIGEAAVRASWRLGDGASLTILANFGATPVACQKPSGAMLFAIGAATSQRVSQGSLPPRSLIAVLEAARA